jgi:hypothetical protein
MSKNTAKDDQPIACALVDLSNDYPSICSQKIKSYVTTKYDELVEAGHPQDDACKMAIKSWRRYAREKERKQRLASKLLRTTLILASFVVIGWGFVFVATKLYIIAIS